MPDDVQHARVGEIELAYETFGRPDDAPVVLVMGLGGQMLLWPDVFCRALVDHGLFVVRFDNRDVGLSTHLDGVIAPELPDLAARTAQAPYTLEDMAADAAGLVDALGLESAHLVGASLGGMIVQVLAIEHPERVRSLTSIMSTTGDTLVGAPTEEAIGALFSPPATSREEAQDRAVTIRRIIGSPGFAFDEDEYRERVAVAYDRSYDPAGIMRQLAAVVSGPDRTERLRTLDVPALVIHGADDPLVNVSGGRATADAIPGAELVVMDGMGHDFPLDLVPHWADVIAAHVQRAEA